MNTISSAFAAQAYCQPYNTGRQDFTHSGYKTVSEQNNPGLPSKDQVALSPEAVALSRNSSIDQTDSDQETNARGTNQRVDSNDNTQQNLSREELRQIQKLQTRDTEVRSHEQAHLAAAGQYAAGGASFSYTTGPDGKRYASGGEVPIDVGREKTPEATIQKMRTVKRAALAPANPSATDRQIAAQAAMTEGEALRELQSAQTKASADETGESLNQETDTDRQSSLNPRHNNNQANESSNQATAAGTSVTAPVADYNRRVMDSSYKAMAALA